MRAVTMERVHNVERVMLIRYIRKDLSGDSIDICFALIINQVIHKKIVSFPDYNNFAEHLFVNEFIDQLWYEHKNKPVEITDFDDQLMIDISAKVIDVKHLNKRVGGNLL